MKLFALISCGLLLTLSATVNADPVVKVDGVEISDEMLAAFVQSRTRQPLSELSEQERETITDELYKLVAVGSEARKRKLQNDPEVAAQLELQELSILAQTLIGSHLESNPVTGDQLQARYDEKFASGTQKEFKARHILVTSPGQATEIIGELKGGADFAALAAKHSTGPSAQSGGDLGWFSKDRMVPEFGNAVEAMETGTYSETPVQTQFGWHVILKEEERNSAPPALGTVSTELERELQQRVLDDFVNGLRERARIKTYQ